MTKEKPGYSAANMWAVLKNAAGRLRKNNPIHLAGATAFLATFSLAPIVVLIIHILGSVIGKTEMQQKIIQKFAEDAPQESVDQLRRYLAGFQQFWGAWYVDVALVLFLLFSASRLFIIIRSSFYQLWRIKQVEEISLRLRFRRWLFPVALIISAGVLLMAGVLGKSLQYLLGDAVAEISPAALSYFNSVYRYAASLVIAWIWFAGVFRYITDARPQWNTVLVGAFFTSVLYNLGKLILQPALSGGRIHQIFGTSAALVILQLFVFYISLLIYYGAAFTLEWAKHYQQPVQIPGHLSYYTLEEKHVKENKEANG